MRTLTMLALLLGVGVLPASGLEVEPLLKTLKGVGPMGQGHRDAAAAWQKLSQAEASQLTTVLAGLNDANPLAANWIRSAAETIAQRQTKSGRPLPTADLERFVLQTSHAPQARRMAFEWLAQADASAPDRLIPGLLHD